MFFNTTHEKDPSEFQKKTISQDNYLLNVLKVYAPQAFTAFDLLPYFTPHTPVTSIRRSLTCLHKAGKIVRKGKREGMFGRDNFTYAIAL